MSSARDMLIPSFLISSPSLKFSIFLYLSHMTISIVDPVSMQDACHTWSLNMAQLAMSHS